jgi:hypothetical protein
MSRAFVNEDASSEPEPQYVLPDREDPGYDEAAAWALLQGANHGNTRSAEMATGFSWGEPALVVHVERILASVIEQGDERFEQLARRFLRAGGR